MDRLRPGDRLASIPAATWNNFVDAAEFVREQRTFGAAAGLAAGSSFGLVPIRNDSGSDRTQFQILRPSGFLFTPSQNPRGFKNAPALIGSAPTADETERFVILQEPIRAGEVGRGLILGTTAVQIEVIDEDDDYASSISANCEILRSQPYGSTWIAYKESGTGTKWAYVVHGIQGSQFLLGKTAASHAKGTTGTINVYRGTTAGSETFTGGDTLSIYNRFGDIASGKWVIACRFQRLWHIICAECA